MVLLVILDAIQNESNFRLFIIVKMVDLLRSGGPSSLLVWRLGEKDAWYFIFFASPEKKNAWSQVKKRGGGKYAAVFFFPLEGFEKTLHCFWSKCSKPHVKVEKSYLIRHLILLLILICKRCLLRFRWVATKEVHMGEGLGKNPLPCPYTQESCVHNVKNASCNRLKKFSSSCFLKINAMATMKFFWIRFVLSTNSNIFYFQQQSVATHLTI